MIQSPAGVSNEQTNGTDALVKSLAQKSGVNGATNGTDALVKGVNQATTALMPSLPRRESIKPPTAPMLW